MNAEVVCPTCGHEHTPFIRLTLETSRRAGKRPATAEAVHVCPECQAVLVLTLRPALQKGSTS